MEKVRKDIMEKIKEKPVGKDLFVALKLFNTDGAAYCVNVWGLSNPMWYTDFVLLMDSTASFFPRSRQPHLLGQEDLCQVPSQKGWICCFLSSPPASRACA